MPSNIGEELEKLLSSAGSKPEAGVSRRLLILSYLSEHPCSTSTMIARFIGTSERGILWHTDAMIRDGILARGGDGTARFFIKGHIREEDCRIFSLLIDERVRRILILLEEKPALSFRTLHDETGLSEYALRRELRSMEEAGLLTSVRDGRSRRYFLTETLSYSRKLYHERRKSAMKLLKEQVSRIAGKIDVFSERDGVMHISIDGENLIFVADPFTGVFMG